MQSAHLAWPFFEQQHREHQAALQRWCSQELARPHVGHASVDAHCRELVHALGDSLWLQACIARPRLDVRTLALTRETLAYHDGLADFAFAMQGLGSAGIGLFGSDALKDRYLPGVASGHRIAAFALSEKDAGSDVAAMTTRARREGGELLIDGEKTWISNGGIADFYTVFVRTGEVAGTRGISAVIVDADAPGLEIVERLEVIAPHPLATVRFRNCRVPAQQMLGEGGDGFRIAMTTLDLFRTTVGAAALGFARRAMDEAVRHCSRRQLFGAPLAAMQMTQAKIADMAVAIEASALLIYRAAWTRDCVKDRVTGEAAMAKLHATEAAQQVIDQAVQLFGGLGVTSGHIAERLYREIRALRIYEGASEVQKLIIAREVMKNAAS